jgi:hypothetical protein
LEQDEELAGQMLADVAEPQRGVLPPDGLLQALAHRSG